MLSERELKIATNLLDSGKPIKIKDLSQELKVSTRTIKYDLDNVKSWFKKHQIDVNSQTNKGIWIPYDADQRNPVIRELLGNERRNQNPDQNFRLKRIILTMLLQNDYITAADLADNLQVSRNTILSDMKSVGEFIAPWMVQLERKRNAGFKMIGEEIHLRLLLENIIYSDLTNYDVYQIMTHISKHESPSGQEFLMDNLMVSVYKVAENQLSELYQPALLSLFRQSDLITLLIRITISVMRLNMGQALKGYRVLNKSIYKDSVSLFILSFMEKVFNEMELPLFEKEFLYLSGEIDKRDKSIDLIQVTNEIIETVSEKEGIDYKRDTKLFSNLFAHLSLRLQRGSIHLAENNPFTEEIKQDYPDLFQSVSEACHIHLNLPLMANQDDFISLISLHFLTSFENNFNKRVRVRTLYVCSTGRGVARLIKNRVEKEISDIKVVAYCSIMEVEGFCKKEKVDLIISVFPIKSEIPVIVVDAIPTKRDIEEIRENVTNLIKKYPHHHSNILFDNKGTFNEDGDSENVSEEIILKGFEVLQELLTVFVNDIEETRMQALQLHIFLMVHRYYFDKQYDDYLYSNHPISEKNKIDIQTIKKILDENELPVHESELIALLQYFK